MPDQVYSDNISSHVPTENSCVVIPFLRHQGTGMKEDLQKRPSCWDEFTLDTGKCFEWRIGPLSVVIRRLDIEWQIAHTRQEDTNFTNEPCDFSETDILPETIENYARYMFRETTGVLTLKPLLADRPVISRPHVPFSLTAGEEVTLYVSTPLWLEVAVGKSRMKLCEIAIQRPSDTWFGPSTREGELCYASTTHCRHSREELPYRAHRAITPVLIRNKVDSTLLIERLNVPAPLLPLYSTPDGHLWTPKIQLLREGNGDMAALKIDTKPPADAKNAKQVSGPRIVTNESGLIRAFSSMFS